MHILILGAYCSCNLGDAVICRCVERQLRAAYPQAEITLRDVIRRDRLASGGVPSETMLLRRRILADTRRRLARVGIDRIAPREERRLKANLSHLEEVCAGVYDAVVVAGGQLFMDGYACFLAFCTERFQERNIPVFFNACGVGPAMSKKVTARLSGALSLPCVRHISCRDQTALAQARYVPAVEIQSAVDPALAAARLLGVEREKHADTLGLGVLYPNGFSMKAALKFWRGILSELECRGEKWQLFTNGDPADIVFARKLLDTMPQLKGREGLIRPADREPEALVRAIAGYKGLISFRLHSHIIAASLDIPTAAVVWDDKLPSFFEKLGCPERCVTLATPASQVLSVLENAGEQGYDRSLLDSLSAGAEAQLVDALQKGAAL